MQDEWKTKFMDLLNASAMLVHHMRRYDDFRAEADKNHRNRFAKKVDDFVVNEKNKPNPKQGKLL